MIVPGGVLDCIPNLVFVSSGLFLITLIVPLHDEIEPH